MTLTTDYEPLEVVTLQAHAAALAEAEQRMRAEMYSMNEMDERCVAAADEARAEALREARDAVAALGHTLECVTNDGRYPERPCNCLHGDAIDAIDALGVAE